MASFENKENPNLQGLFMSEKEWTSEVKMPEFKHSSFS